MNVSTSLINVKNAPNLNARVEEGRRQSRLLLDKGALLVAQALVERIDCKHSVSITCKEEFDAYSELIGVESFCPPNCVVMSIVNLPRNGPNYTIGFCDHQLKTILNVAFTLRPDLHSEEDKKEMRGILHDAKVENGFTLVYNLEEKTVHPVCFE